MQFPKIEMENNIVLFKITGRNKLYTILKNYHVVEYSSVAVCVPQYLLHLLICSPPSHSVILPYHLHIDFLNITFHLSLHPYLHPVYAANGKLHLLHVMNNWLCTFCVVSYDSYTFRWDQISIRSVKVVVNWTIPSTCTFYMQLVTFFVYILSYLLKRHKILPLCSNHYFHLMHSNLQNVLYIQFQ